MSDFTDETEEKKVEETSTNESEETLQEIVNNWINEHIRNSPLSASAEAWSHLLYKLPVLIKNIVNRSI